MTRRTRTPFVVLLSVAAGVVVYLGFAAERAARLYADLADPVRAFRGRLHHPDPELGFAPTPDAVGAEVFRREPEIPVRYDADGFRVPRDAAPGPRARPLVLALGCSFTFGQGVAAESAFAHLVGERLGGSTANAGVCGWGLAQMLVAARRDVERLRPEVVLVQLSPWLAQRAVATRAPTGRGALPTPYFTGARGDLRLAPPRFATRLVGLEQGRYGAEGWSWSGLAGFLVRDGVPLVVHDDVQGALERVRVALGVTPPPATDVAAVEEAAVTELVALARRSGAEVVVVSLGAGRRSERVSRAVLQSGALVVDANAALRGRLPDPTDAAYQAAYWQRRGDPPQWDPHPNERAHRAVADAVVAALRARRAAGSDPLPAR